MKSQPERRFVARAKCHVEKRSEEEVQIVGYAALFYDGTPDTEYDLWDGACERIAVSAFDRALSEKHDVRALYNHDDNCVLGRTASGTMRLVKDAVGLRYEIDAPNTALASDLIELLTRGDISGSSFAFVATGVNWTTEDDGCEIRTITDLDLLDVGPVTYPAYEATSSFARTVDTLKEERSKHLVLPTVKIAHPKEFLLRRARAWRSRLSRHSA